MYDKVKSGNRLRELREAMGRTQLEVANEIGIAVDTIRKLEQGKRGPSIAVIDMLSDYYNITVDYIITGDNKEHNEDIYTGISANELRDVERIIKNIEDELRDIKKIIK